MKKILTMVCGIPGSGKSTWLSSMDGMSSVSIISRDHIRFSMLKDGDDYFAKENEVFNKFIEVINQEIECDDIQAIYVDATHLNPKARNKVLSKLNLENCSLHAVYFDIPLSICLERNAKREGRALVPETAICNMNNSYVFPTLNEGFNYIWRVDENGLMTLKNERSE